MQKKRTKVTLKMIAKDVGCSTSLVSKVLSGRMGKSSVSLELGLEIKNRALKLGYKSNPIASALRRGNTNTIGVIVYRHDGQPGSENVESLIDGVTKVINNTHFRLHWLFFSNETEFVNQIKSLEDVDGIIINRSYSSIIGSDFYIEKLKADGIPTVSFTNLGAGITYADISQTSVGYIATKHLIEQGCKKIITFKNEHMTSRYEGYIKAHEEAKLPINQSLIIKENSYSPDNIPNYIKGLTKKKIEFDGIVCNSDIQGIAAMRTLLSLNKKIPDDVKVIGVDDSPFARYGIIPLSSVYGCTFDRATWAANTLLKLIDNPKCDVESTIFEPRLVVRTSTKKQ